LEYLPKKFSICQSVAFSMRWQDFREGALRGNERAAILGVRPAKGRSDPVRERDLLWRRARSAPFAHEEHSVG